MVNNGNSGKTAIATLQCGVCITGAAGDDSQILDNLHDVQQLEALLRAHMIKAQMMGSADPRHMEVILLAHGFLMRIWEVAIEENAAIIREVSKMMAMKESDQPVPTKTSAKGGKGKKPPPKEDVSYTYAKQYIFILIDEQNVHDFVAYVYQSGKSNAFSAFQLSLKDKAKRDYPAEYLPGSLDDWSDWDVCDEALDAFKTEQLKHTSINGFTFKNPVSVAISCSRSEKYSQASTPVRDL